MRQSFSGAPVLTAGDGVRTVPVDRQGAADPGDRADQGLFSLPHDGGADPVATRAATRELMLDTDSGRPVKDQTLTMPLSELRSRISTTLAAAKRSQVK